MLMFPERQLIHSPHANIQPFEYIIQNGPRCGTITWPNGKPRNDTDGPPSL